MTELVPLEVLTESRILHIPLYQRGYSWEITNWEELMADLEALDDAYNHYIGPVVYSSRPERFDLQGYGNQTLERINIEDGQQRITTLFVALFNLQDLITTREDCQPLIQFAHDIRRKILFYAPRIPANREEYIHPRLMSDNDSFNNTLNALFKKQPIPPLETQPQKRLLKLHNHIRKSLEKKSATELSQLYSQLIQRLRFVFINLSDHNINSQIAFHTLNTRGVHLKELDKVKNFLIYEASQQAKKLNIQDDTEVESGWFKVISTLDEHDLANHEDSFLALSYAITFKLNQVPSNKDVTETILDDLHKATNKIEYIKQITSSWTQFIDAYCSVQALDKASQYSSHPTNGQVINDYVDALRRLDSIQLQGVVLPINLVLATKEIETKAQLAPLLEKYVFRVHAVAGKRIDHNRRALLNLAQDLNENSKSIDTIAKTIMAYILGVGEMPQVLTRMFDSDAFNYGVQHTSRLHYFLLEYEHYLSQYDGHPLIWKKPKTTIEHICPQQQSGSGSEYLRFQALDPTWQQAFESEPVWKQTRDQLGNLTLTNDNQKLGNKSWVNKYKLYQNGTYSEKELTNFASQNEWNIDSVKKREQKLAQFVVTRWNIGLDSEQKVALPPSIVDADITHIASDHEIIYNRANLQEISIENIDDDEIHEDGNN